MRFDDCFVGFFGCFSVFSFLNTFGLAKIGHLGMTFPYFSRLRFWRIPGGVMGVCARAHWLSCRDLPLWGHILPAAWFCRMGLGLLGSFFFLCIFGFVFG